MRPLGEDFSFQNMEMPYNENMNIRENAQKKVERLSKSRIIESHYLVERTTSHKRIDNLGELPCLFPNNRTSKSIDLR